MGKYQLLLISSFFKIFGGHKAFLVGPLIPVFSTSGDVRKKMTTEDQFLKPHWAQTSFSQINFGISSPLCLEVSKFIYYMGHIQF